MSSAVTVSASAAKFAETSLLRTSLMMGVALGAMSLASQGKARSPLSVFANTCAPVTAPPAGGAGGSGGNGAAGAGGVVCQPGTAGGGESGGGGGGAGGAAGGISPGGGQGGAGGNHGFDSSGAAAFDGAVSSQGQDGANGARGQNTGGVNASSGGGGGAGGFGAVLAGSGAFAVSSAISNIPVKIQAGYGGRGGNGNLNDSYGSTGESGAGGAGGIGVFVGGTSVFSVVNTASGGDPNNAGVSGGGGGTGGYGYSQSARGGNGGAGIFIANGSTLTTNGVIRGGNSGLPGGSYSAPPSSANAGNAGAGVYLANGGGVVSTGGTIYGGFGAGSATGGAGVQSSQGGAVTNTGDALITGGRGGYSYGRKPFLYKVLQNPGQAVRIQAAVAGTGGAGVMFAASGVVLNTGARIIGGYGGGGNGSNGGTGGAGIVMLAGGAINNAPEGAVKGQITGGTGGSLYTRGSYGVFLTSGTGGAGIYAVGVSINNTGLGAVISGGAGGPRGNSSENGPAPAGGAGGAGITGKALNINNTGTGASIIGGVGGAGVAYDPCCSLQGAAGAANGGAGGAGISASDSAITNSGSIAGGAGGSTYKNSSFAAAGGLGITGSNLFVINSGTISGGAAGGVTGSENGPPLPLNSAIVFTGGVNQLELRAGSVINGNAIAFSAADTLALGGSANASFDVSKIAAAGATTVQYQKFGVFEKRGASTWTLTGATPAVTSWTVLGGTLAISSDGNLGAPAGSLTLNGGNLQNTASLTSSRSFILGGTGGGINTDGGTLLKLTGSFTGAGPLAKLGAGTLQMAGTATYTGVTSVNAGTLQGGAVNAFSAGSFINIAAAGTVDLNGFSQTIGGLAGTGAITNAGAAAAALTIGADNSSSSFGGVIQDGSAKTGIAKTGTGVLVLTGANTYSGGTSVNGGTLRGGAGNAFSAASLLTIGAAGAVDLFGFSQSVNAVAGTGTITNAGAAAASLAIGGDNSSSTFSGVIKDGASKTGVVKNGAGALTLAGSNTYSGPTLINQGRFIGAAINSFSAASAITIAAPGALDLGGFAQTIGSIAGAGAITNTGAAAASLTVGADNSSSSFGGVIQDGSAKTGLAKAGAGVLTLAGANTYSGPTSVNGGTLRAGAVNTFSAGSLLAVAATASVDLNGFSQTVSALTGAGTVTNAGASAARLTVGADNSSNSFGGLIRDGSAKTGIAKTGTGVLVLTGANTYSGGTAIQSGILAIASGNALGTGTVTLKSGGALQFAAPNLVLANNIDLPGTLDPVIDTGANNSAVAGVISGGDTLTKTGAGTLTLTGISTLTGGTTVAGGALSVTGSLASSAVTVNSGTSLAGSGTVGGIAALSGATVAPGQITPFSTLSVNGNVSFLAGSAYNVQITAAGQTDRINATGTAALGGGTVAVNAGAGTYNPATTYTILSAAGGVTGRFATLTTTTNLAFLTPLLTYTGTNVILGFTQNAAVTFPAVAGTPNEISSAAGVQSLTLGNPVYNAVLSQTAVQARQSFNALSGEIHASAVTAAYEDSRFVREAILDRLFNTSGDYVPVVAPAAVITKGPVASRPPVAYASAPYAFWGQGFGDWGHNSGDGNAATLKRSLGGFVLGADASVYGPWRIGVAGGYTTDSLTVRARNSSGTLESIYGAVYGGASFDAINIRTGLAYASTRTKTSRGIALVNFNDAASASYSGSIFQGFGEAGYRIAFGQGVIEPMVGAAFIHVDQNGFVENGGAARLRGAGRSTDFETTTVGLRGEINPIAAMPLTLRGLLGWRHAYGTSNPKAVLSFASGSLPFTVSGAPIARDAAMVEVIVDWRATSALTIGVSYSGQLSSKVQDHSLKGNILYKF